MKIIKVTSCDDCPHLEFSSSGRETFWCGKCYTDIAYEREIVVKEAIISSTNMLVTPAQKKWTFVLEDEKTEWIGGIIPEWCPLEENDEVNETSIT
jgi:hypothetical protein